MPVALKPKVSGSGRILFIGSSSTAGTNSYVEKLHTTYPFLSVTKIAQVGALTSWMVEQSIDEILEGGYDAVVIFGGLNDIYATGSTDQAKANLQYLIDAIDSVGAISVLITVQPTDYYISYTETKGALTTDLNNWILASDAVYAIDFYSRLVNENGVQNTALFQPDNLHLSDTAHQMLADEISATIF